MQKWTWIQHRIGATERHCLPCYHDGFVEKLIVTQSSRQDFCHLPFNPVDRAVRTKGGQGEELWVILRRWGAPPVAIHHVEVLARISIRLVVGAGFADWDQRPQEDGEFIDDDKANVDGGNHQVSRHVATITSRLKPHHTLIPIEGIPNLKPRSTIT